MVYSLLYFLFLQFHKIQKLKALTGLALLHEFL